MNKRNPDLSYAEALKKMPDAAVFSLPMQRDKNGSIVALIAQRGGRGYMLTDWVLGQTWDEAEAAAAVLNTEAGISADEANKIVYSTMKNPSSGRTEPLRVDSGGRRYDFVMTPITRQTANALKRYREDLAAGHTEGAEYWRGMAANPKEALMNRNNPSSYDYSRPSYWRRDKAMGGGYIYYGPTVWSDKHGYGPSVVYSNIPGRWSLNMAEDVYGPYPTLTAAKKACEGKLEKHHATHRPKGSNPTYAQEMQAKHGVPFDPTRLRAVKGFRFGDRVRQDSTGEAVMWSQVPVGAEGTVWAVAGFRGHSISPDPAHSMIMVRWDQHGDQSVWAKALTKIKGKRRNPDAGDAFYGSNRLTAAIGKVNAKVATLSAEKRAKIVKDMATSQSDLMQYQSLQAQAHASGKITTSEALTLFKIYGGDAASVSHWNKLSIGEQYVGTQIAGELAEWRIKQRGGTIPQKTKNPFVAPMIYGAGLGIGLVLGQGVIKKTLAMKNPVEGRRGKVVRATGKNLYSPLTCKKCRKRIAQGTETVSFSFQTKGEAPIDHHYHKGRCSAFADNAYGYGGKS